MSSKFPNWRKVDRNDYRDAPAWFHRFAEQLNRHMEDITNNLQEETEEEREFQVLHGVEFPVTLEKIASPSRVLIVSKRDQFGNPAEIDWKTISPKKLRVKMTFAADPGKRVEVRLVFQKGAA